MRFLQALFLASVVATFCNAQASGSGQPTAPAASAPAPTSDLTKVIRPILTIPKFAAAPVIDGKLDEEVWKHAPALGDFIQTSPADHVPATKPTQVLLGYDANNLYVAFKCWDDRDKIRSSVVQRDRVFGEDNVQLWLDTYNDQRRAYMFAFNPMGIQADGVQTESQGTDFNVDLLFESKGLVEDWGWTVEIKIPFKSLRYAAGKGKFWGFNAARNIARNNNEFDSWVALPRGVPGFMNKFGKITGLDDIAVQRTLEVIPTFTLKETGFRTSQTRFSNPPMKADFGFTAKYSISPNITLDAAYNPDFADTEADAPVVEANQRFPIYFSEKRPFFLEGVDIFKTSIQAVYTRRVENPDIALKLTGKIGKTSFGVFGAVDDPLYNPYDKKAFAGVLRLKRDIGKESNIGILATSYSYPQKHNHVAGIDGRWKIDTPSQYRGQILFSTTRNYFYHPFTDNSQYQTGNGVSFSHQYSYSKKNYGWGLGGDGTSTRYRSDLGFTRQVNSMNHFVYSNLNADPTPKSLVVRKSMGGSFGVRNTFGGRMQGFSFDSYGNLGFKGNAGIGGGMSIGTEKIYEDEFGPARSPTRLGTFFGAPFRDARQFSMYTYMDKQINKRFSVFGNFNMSINGFDYDFGAGRDYPRVSPAAVQFGQDAPMDPGTAKGLYFGFGSDLKPTDKFSLYIGYDRSSLRRNATNRLAYESNYFSFSSAYQFSRFINLKSRIYYDTLSDNISGQYTFAWTPSVGKALYIGYNSRLSYKGYVYDRPQTGFLQMNRTFFIKLSYLFRKSFN